MARRDPVGIRLLTRRGNDWSSRFPLIMEAINHLRVRSCLIDGEVVCCDERGVAVFHVLRHRRNEQKAFLYAFDLLELDGADMRREPIEVRKAIAYWERLSFELPRVPAEQAWRRWIDTALASPDDICPWECAPAVTQATYDVQPRSVVFLIRALEEPRSPPSLLAAKSASFSPRPPL